MPLKVYCADSSSLKPSNRFSGVLLPIAASLMLCLNASAFGQREAATQQRVAGGCGASGSGRQAPVRVQQRGVTPLNLCEGQLLGGGLASSSSGEPVALASADFDEDGVPDLVSGFATGNGGNLTIHRGNVQALWPYGAAILNGPPQPFFPDARTFTLPERPDFIATGDFDADGHLDVVTAQRGSTALYFLKGNGHGTMLAPKRINLAGSVNAMISGEINRADGLADIMVSLDTASGPRALVYESPKGAIKAEPEIFKLPHSATALALGRFDGGPMNGLAIGAGDQLMIVHGRDRQLSSSAAQRALVSPAKVTQQTLPYTVSAIVSGDFTDAGPSVAALGSDRRIHILEGPLSQKLISDAAASDPNYVPTIQVAGAESEHAVGGTLTPGVAAKIAFLRKAGRSGTSAWTERSTVDLPSGFSQRVPQLLAGRVAGSQQQNVLAPDTGNSQLHVLATAPTHQRSIVLSPQAARSVTPLRAPMQLLASLQTDSAPAAVLPMRLSRHGLNGLVMLQEGKASPVLMPQDVPPANIFVVTNTLDAPKDNAPAGSLRYAMNQVEAASSASGGGNYEIDFNIPTSDPGYKAATGTFLIQPLSENVPNSFDNFALPPINATVTIDGYTQPGASPNTLTNGDNAKILIQIDGSKATTSGGSGFVPFDDIGSVFRGMDFTGWTNAAVSNGTASGAEGIEANGVGDFIEGNFFGTDPTGKVATSNRIGIFADNGPLFGSAPGNIIGGSTPQARNILSGNSNSGILLLSTAYEAQLQGNFIGLDATGTTVVPSYSGSTRSNLFDGVGLNGPTVTIGGTLPGATNFIAGNGTNVDINDLTNGGAASNSTVQGNVIGTNASGTAGIPDEGYGVSILHTVSKMLIGGTVKAARNVISGNLAGVYVFDNSFQNTVQGNYIGTDVTGTKAVPNLNQGIISGSTGSTETAAGNTLIGGMTPDAGNVISGNISDGINISGVSVPPGSQTPAGNTIQGNFIGSSADGTTSLPNGGAGISLTGSTTNNLIGGSEPGSTNLISYNSSHGVFIDSGASGTGNQTIANVINANSGAGVRVNSGTGSRISQNSIFGNQALGIDIDASGPATIAHCNAPNSGANNLQNFPTLTAGTGSLFISATATDPNGNTSEFSKTVAATKAGDLLTLLGSFDSTANTKFTIEFFSNPTADASGYGQGQTYLGSATITTDANCGATISDPVDVTQADVSVTLTQPSALIAGPDMGVYAYTGTVTNNGVASAHNVVFTDTLPSQLAISSAYCNVASCQSSVTTTLGTCTISGQTITCNLGTLAPGATAVVTIPVQTLTSGTVADTATVSATEVDPNPANNTATTSASAVYPFPFLDHLDPATVLAGSADLPLTIYGEQLLNSSTVDFNGTALPVKGFLDNQVCGGPFQSQICSALQVVVPAALLSATGTPAVTVTNPDPGEGGGANSPSALNLNVVASCTYSVFSFLDGENLSADGSGLIAESASVSTNVASCPWTATSSVPWAMILDNSAAAGSGHVDVNVAANTGATSRTGTVTIAGQTLTFTQSGGSSCPNTLDSSAVTVPAAGGTGTDGVTTGGSCSYFVVPYADWITIPQKSGLLVGNGTASYVVAPNHGAPRTGSVAVGGTTLTINQQSPTCYFTLDASSALIPVGGGTGTIAVTASSPSCSWTATSSNSSQLAITSGASGTGNGTVEYSLPVNTGGAIAPTLTIGTADGYSVFTANQASAFTCTFAISPTPRSVTSLGTSDFFTITASFNFCKWTATSNDPTELTINQGSSGMGTAAVYYTVGKNTSNASRVLTINAGCQTFTINQSAPLASNPVPAITSLLPTTVVAGSGAATLTVTGSNFVNGAVINFNGTARATTYVSSTQVTAALLAADVATAGTYPVTVTNPTPGSGISNSVNFTVTAAQTNNPVPTITTLQPASITASAGATTLTINGTNFITGSVVNFNGVARATTYVSATKVTAALLATDVATAGTYPVTVANPSPGGGTSNSVNFMVSAATVNNPVPTITTLQPASVNAGAGASTLTVNGTNFITGSVVNYNGAAKTTAFVSATQLTASLAATDVAAAGVFPVTVTNPAPGGGTSNSVNFTVSAVVTPTPQASLSSTTITFPSTSPTTAAAAQAVTLTNSGTATLNITSISITGTNASAFAQTNTCGTSLAAGANCSISVVFTPSATGSFTASLSVADDATGSPQSVSLSGTGSAEPSFTVASANTSQTVVAGGSAQYSLTVSAVNGTFPGTVTLSASGLPPGATASFSPATLSPGSSSATSVLTIQTGTSTVVSAGLTTGKTLAVALLPLALFFFALRKRRRILMRLASMALAMVSVSAVLTGCGGGFGSAAAAKTYNITITATSGETVQITTVQLIVK